MGTAVQSDRGTDVGTQEIALHCPPVAGAEKILTPSALAFVAMLELTAVHIAYRSDQRRLATRIRSTARWLVPAVFVAVNFVLILHFLN